MKTIINKISKKLNLPFQENKAKIEYLGLGKITGWVFNRKINLTEVRLILGNKIVSKSNVEIERSDVCQKYNYQGKTGFELKLPTNLKNFDKDANIKIIALSSNGQKIFELISKRKRKQIYQKIREILNSSYLGLHGNLDGIQSDGLIHGWASWMVIKKTAWVWLQCEGHEPKSFKCNVFREDVSETEFKSRKVGFTIDPYKLDKSYSEKSFFVSFDNEGKYKLPEAKSESLPLINKFEEVINESIVTVIDQKKESVYLENQKKAPNKLKESWQELENFRLFLDGLETQLVRSEKIIIMQEKSYSQNNFFKKMKKILQKKY